MAKSTVPVNFKDDIMNSAMGGKRRYRMINNSDGTISLEDVTTYDQVGSTFGAAQLNATNTAVNAAADASKIIDDIDAIRATTQSGYMAGALALKQVDDSLEELETNLSGLNNLLVVDISSVKNETTYDYPSGYSSDNLLPIRLLVKREDLQGWFGDGNIDTKTNGFKVACTSSYNGRSAKAIFLIV